MCGKAVVLFAIFAAVHGGVVAPAAVSYISAPHVGAQSEHTFRGSLGLSSVSKQAKAVDSAFSSVRSNDVRVTNTAALVAAAPVAYAAPAYASYSAPSPAYQYAATPAFAPAPVAYAAPARVAYTAPAAAAYGQTTYSGSPAYAKVAAAPVAYSAPAPVAVAKFAPAPVYASFAAAPVAYSAPAPVAVAKFAAAPAYSSYAAPAAIAPVAKLGVAYSAVSPAVATLSFNGYGISYGY